MSQVRVPEILETVTREDGSPTGVPIERVAVGDPTQIRRPLRSTVRTVFQAFIGLCALAPILVELADLDPAKLPWLASALLVAAAVTRVMANPAVEKWLRKYFKWLAAAPSPVDEVAEFAPRMLALGRRVDEPPAVE